MKSTAHDEGVCSDQSAVESAVNEQQGDASAVPEGDRKLVGRLQLDEDSLLKVRSVINLSCRKREKGLVFPLVKHECG